MAWAKREPDGRETGIYRQARANGAASIGKNTDGMKALGNELMMRYIAATGAATDHCTDPIDATRSSMTPN
jgi:hypothetical protein